MTASLVLQDGTSFSGQLFGARKPVAGEVVFNTGMVGYTESLTDPSYRGQILALTYPLVGNYGVPEHLQSEKIQISALVVSELVSEYSHSMARKSLPQWLEEQGIPCLAGIDTRALTRRLRSHGCMLGKIVVDEAEVEFDDPNRGDLVAEVGPERRTVYVGGRRTVVVVDCGYKASIIDELRARPDGDPRGCRLRLPRRGFRRRAGVDRPRRPGPSVPPPFATMSAHEPA